MYAVPWSPASNSNGGENRVDIAHASGLSVSYGGNELHIKSEETQELTVSVFNATGMVVLRVTPHLTERHVKVGLSALQPGIYVARVVDSDGNFCSIKFQK